MFDGRGDAGWGSDNEDYDAEDNDYGGDDDVVPVTWLIPPHYDYLCRTTFIERMPSSD